MKLALLSLVFLASFALAWPAPQHPQEGKAQACDNDSQSRKRGVDHNCKCEHTAMACDTPPDQVYMSDKCSSYCDPKHCTCAPDKCS